MLNLLWAFMMIIGIVWGCATGRVSEISSAILDSGSDAINLCISMLGIMCIWCGVMETAKEGGLLDKLARLLDPFISLIFPEVPKTHPARAHISLNITANILGLGWAATPSGLAAMKELSALNKHSQTASSAMCSLLILNISSLQLIPVNIIAYRAQYGAQNPADIIAPSLAATTASTAAAILFILIMRLFHSSAYSQRDDAHS